MEVAVSAVWVKPGVCKGVSRCALFTSLDVAAASRAGFISSACGDCPAPRGRSTLGVSLAGSFSEPSLPGPCCADCGEASPGCPRLAIAGAAGCAAGVVALIGRTLKPGWRLDDVNT